ncbi:hypothetical protein JCM6882_002197 [Rhodosporidiobolus microsporus]
MSSAPSRRAAVSALFLVALVLLQAVVVSASGVFNCAGGSVQIVAHPDDDILFQSPTLYNDFDDELCITSIFLTSGDSGSGLGYAQSRETGNGAAYAYMADTNSTWSEFYATFGGQPVLVRTLVAAPQVQRVFFRLPDGQMDGSGVAVTGYQSLRKLYFGSISTIDSIDGEATFSLATLREALGQILTARAPDTVRTLDHLSDYDSGDHADHYTAARLASEAAAAYASSASFAGYMGYPVQNLAPTISTSSDDFARKTGAFFAYTPYDYAECQSFSACAGRGEYYWLQREYIVTPELATNSSDGSAETPATLPSGENIARLATTTASSYYNYGGIVQPPSAAIDGVKGGYPGNDSVEWSSNGEGAGAWLKLTWTEEVTIGGVVLYDRPNTADWLTEGTLTMDDGSILAFSLPYNDGSPNVLSLSRNYTTTSLLMTVTTVAAGGSNVGLSEIEVYGSLCPTCNASATSASSSASSTAVSSTSSSSTSTSATSTTPSSAIPTASSTQSANLALGADAAASSYASATDQGPEKAVDGVISGYKADGTGDYTKEWASDHEGVGATLSLSWDAAITINQLVLFDRPNTDDQILNASIWFSDGSTVYSGVLDNAGGATYVNFTTRTIDSLVLTVTSVSSTTGNVGLAELQAYLVSSASTSSSAASTPVCTGSVSTSSSASVSASPSATQVPSTSASSSGSSSASSTRSTVSFSSSSTSTATATSSSAAPTSTGLYNFALHTDSYDASSYASATDQGPEKAIDGMISGYKEDGTGDYTKEWATDHQSTGAWIGISWPESITVNQLVLYDRPNLNDQMTGATVSFSDGSSFQIGALDNAGGATVFNFTARVVDSMFITVTSVSDTTTSVGLSEIQVYYVPPTTSSSSSVSSVVSTSTVPVTTATPASSSSTVSQAPESSSTRSTVSFVSSTSTTLSNSVSTSSLSATSTSSTSTSSQLSSSSSSPVSTGSATSSRSTVSFSSSSTSTLPPSSSSVATSTSSSSASPSATGLYNYALHTDSYLASSYGTDQGPEKAIDGVINGYKADGSGDYTKEWASSGQGSGAWIGLSWPETITVNQLVLYDRPNLDDQVTGATISFSDGSSFTIGALVNLGAATYVNFTSRAIDSLFITVTSVSSTTSNVGLSEIQVYNNPQAIHLFLFFNVQDDDGLKCLPHDALVIVKQRFPHLNFCFRNPLVISVLLQQDGYDDNKGERFLLVIVQDWVGHSDHDVARNRTGWTGNSEL